MREMDRIIEKANGQRPRLLLHSCCGPCSSSCLELLVKYFDVSILWYNPNIYPVEEYNKRFATLVELVEKMELTDSVQILTEPYKSDVYYEAVKGLENEPEGGARCAKCFRLRLMETAKIAKQYGFDYFCSSLTLSRHKDAVLINSLGEDIGKVVGIQWLPSEFKKRNGENRSIELCEKFNLYRQLYCGCEFSLRNREEHEKQNPED